VFRNILIALAILLVFWLAARRPGAGSRLSYRTICRRTLPPAIILGAVFMWRVFSVGETAGGMGAFFPLLVMTVSVWLLAAAVIWSLGRRR